MAKSFPAHCPETIWSRHASVVPISMPTGALLSLDDASLAAMGLTRDELRRRPHQRSII
jgi:hypothetical protein